MVIVKRLVSYGAFVEVFPGVEGLVHISQIAHKHIGTPHEVLKEGQEVNVKVLETNETDQRLSLSIKELLEKEYDENFDYVLPEESKGFQLGEVIGDKLKNLKNNGDLIVRSERKWDHIRFALENRQEHSSAFNDIKFIHQSLPNISVSDVGLDLKMGELYLRSPIFINAMTGGGGEKTFRINKELAMVAKNTGPSAGSSDGEHTDEILKELGYSAEDIKTLRKDAAV